MDQTSHNFSYKLDPSPLESQVAFLHNVCDILEIETACDLAFAGNNNKYSLGFFSSQQWTGYQIICSDIRLDIKFNI